jgi:hypothetical protein
VVTVTGSATAADPNATASATPNTRITESPRLLPKG